MTLLTTPNIQIGSFGKVQLRVLDQYNNVAISESRKIEAAATGSAIGASVIAFHAGSAYFYLTNQQAETVTISLLDTFSTGLDVSPVSQVTFTTGLLLVGGIFKLYFMYVL